MAKKWCILCIIDLQEIKLLLNVVKLNAFKSRNQSRLSLVEINRDCLYAVSIFNDKELL